MASRSQERAITAIQKVVPLFAHTFADRFSCPQPQLKTMTGKEAIFLKLDLADLDAVTRATNEFKSKERELHILFNSGCVYFSFDRYG